MKAIVGGIRMANLSQEKRQRMLSFLNQLKAKNRDDDETLMAINEIENALNEKNMVWYGSDMKRPSM